MKYVKLIAKPDFWYKPGSEVFDYEGRRFTVEKFKKEAKTGALLCRGLKNNRVDGEYCILEEFVVELTDEYKEMK